MSLSTRLPVILLAALAGCSSLGSSRAVGAVDSTSTTTVAATTSAPAASTASTASTAATAKPVAASFRPGECHLVHSFYPDPGCGAGAVSPRVTQANLADTVCSHQQFADPASPNGPKVSWNARERALYLGKSASSTRKRQMLTAYGLPDSTTSKYELDHIVPISIGGDPQAVANTFPEPWDGSHGAKAKDSIETSAWHDLCAGRITLAEAQAPFLGSKW